MKTQKVQPTIPFSGLLVFGGTKTELLYFLSSKLEENLGRGILTICTPNPEQLVLKEESADFSRALTDADILLPDGAGLVWAINRRQKPAHRLQRIPGRGVFHDLLEIAAKQKQKVFLVGGQPGSARQIAAQYGLGWEFDDGPKERDTQILERIRQEKPDIVFIAYGAPSQELWMMNHRSVLEESGVKIAMVVGGAFEYEAGMVPVVLPQVEKLHLEWLQRLITQPWRWRRQLTGFKFFWWVLTGKYKAD